MSKKINSYFLVFIIMFSMLPVHAAAPIKYYEINSDIELRGAIFIDVDPSSFYAAYNNGIIEIASSEHFENVSVKFKGIALINKLKKYNGFNIGYAHIDDNGIITNELKPLEIDNQGFAYLNTDFSTVIINGMTGTTTQTYTGQSGNQSFNVPAGSSYDLNITNNQAGVYLINGLDWEYKLTYYQDTAIAFNNTQYELNNSNFPITQNIFNNISSDGNGLPIVNFTYLNNTNIPFWVEYWNSESDFKLYTKSTSLIENQSLNLYYGGNDGLNSSNSITDTMLAGSVFDDLTGWIQQSGTWVAGDTLTSTPDAFLRHNGQLSTSSDFIVEMRAKSGDNFYPAIISKSDNPLSNSIGYSVYGYTYTTLSPRFRSDGANSDGSTQLLDFTWYRTKAKLHLTSGNNAAEIYTDTGVLVDSAVQASDSTNTEDYFGIYNLVDGDMEIDWFFIRKYTATEPTYTISTPQTVSGTVNITASITGDSNTQSYNTSQSREFPLTPAGTTNNVNVNTSSTDYNITITTYWTDDTTLQTETAANGYAKQYINYTPTDYNVSADLNTTFTFDFTTQDYIGTTTSTLNDVSKTTYRNGQDVNASVGELIAGINYFWNVTVPYNNIFTLSNQSDQTAYLGISKQFNDSDYNDPDSNPILSRLWEFGDGGSSINSNPSHTYTSLGNLSANYTVTEDATTNSQTITKEFNVSVVVQPVQNLITADFDQAWIRFNWSDYSSADLWNISELEESAPKFNGTIILDGLKDDAYNDYAHGFVFDTPNPVSNLNYETVHWIRNNTHLIGHANGYDNDVLGVDDTFTIGIDGTNDNLTSDDTQWILSESGTVTAKSWNVVSGSWITTSTDASGFVIGAGVGGSITYEMIIPISEINGFVDDSEIKFFMQRTDSSLHPPVVSFYPTNLINDTDTSIWDVVILTDSDVYNFVNSTIVSEYNVTGLAPYTWYKHRIVTINNSIESTPVYSIDITEDVPHYSVSGYIIDTFGNGISGAVVHSENGIIGEITQSDINGYYIGYNFKAGNYSIHGNKSGYADNFTNVYVTGNMTNINVTLSPFIISDWEIYQELLLIQSQNDEILLNMSVNNTIINDKLDTVLIFILLNMAVIVGVIIGRRGKENDK